MIRRFVCLLLVPLMLANQGLCFAHAHHGSDVAASEDHASRPHYHVGDHHHHDSAHSHDHDAGHQHGHHSGRNRGSDDNEASLPSAIAPVSDHDADAVYLAETVTLACDGKSLTVLSVKCMTSLVFLRVAVQGDDWLLRLGLIRGQPPSVFEATCPIYLRTLSLRI